MVTVQEYFDINYGTSLSLSDLEEHKSGINFISRTSQNNGVSSKVILKNDVEPIPLNTISVAVGGSVMESFLQEEPYYAGYHIRYLMPKFSMSKLQLLYYCACLRANKYKYSYGRQANRTLKDLLIPSLDEIPEWVLTMEMPEEPSKAPIEKNKKEELFIREWKKFKYRELFDVEKGKEIISKCSEGDIPLISATRENNGVSNYVTGQTLFQGGTITVAMNGASTGEAFYQEKAFYATADVNILIPKFTMNKYIALFITTIIGLEKYRFNYGRKWNVTRMNNSDIELPINEKKEIDFEFIEKYIKTLEYSSNI